MPPLPPGILRPNLPLPPGVRPPQLGGPGLPNPFAQNAPARFQGAPAYSQAAAESAAETGRMKEEKDKLEKKILEMEKLLSQEKERALLATLKNQQDETLSSKVESSLKDIQDRMRRDKRDQQVEEERLTLKGKIKELETRLTQERETWMQSLKEQMAEREHTGRDVEGHFIYRLQEMERRWLDEKAQWQKEISSREDTIRSLQSASERLREAEDEVRRVSFDKSMADKEISKLRDDVARSDREKASIESYIKMLPEKERELAELRSENAVNRLRQEKAHDEAKHQEEKYLFEIEKLQRELGGLSDKKNSEKAEELKAQAARHEDMLHEKDKTIAEVSGEKARAISELVKIKGFVLKVQAINSVLDKERGHLRVEKMQLAQNMAAQLEEIKKLRQELELLKTSRRGEIEDLSKRYCSEIEDIKSKLPAEMSIKHAEKIAELSRQYADKTDELNRRHQEEISSRLSACQAEMDSKISALRSKLERSASDDALSFKNRLEDEYTAKFRQLKELALASDCEKTRLEIENRRLSEECKKLETAAVSEQDKFSTKVEEQRGALAAQKDELERCLRTFEYERSKMTADLAATAKRVEAFAAQKSAVENRLEALVAQKSAVEAEFARLSGALEAKNADCASFETELIALKNKINELEQLSAEKDAMFEAERGNADAMQASTQAQLAEYAAKTAELAEQLEKYKAVEGSLGARLKWAIAKKSE